MNRRIPLEPEAIAVCDAASVPPLIFQLPPVQGRLVLEKMQNAPVYKYPADIIAINYHAGDLGVVKVYYVWPGDASDVESVIYYIHGAGWVFGSFHTHEKLVRELAARTNSLVVFPEYYRSPEVRYPVAIEQCYSLLVDLPGILAKNFPQASIRSLTVAGDSVGGNMTIAMTLMAKERGGIRIDKQLMYYPVTDSCFDTSSYDQFAVDYYLYRQGMKWFWQQYAPLVRSRDDIYASPLKASLSQLRSLPPAMIINGEADVLRDEGECYAKKLREAGNDVTAVRIQGIIHDFVMLNALDQTDACRAAMDASVEWIIRK
ncbi:MAG: alpha/beta hydrolase [Lachnospiraceae bacterium]